MNLYWPVYKNIEHEILELSTKIHFDDNQLSVYSNKISELIIRAVVEIEALAKELYYICGGLKPNDKDLFFDTDCLDLLEQTWSLSKKTVIINSHSCYFNIPENRILYPLFKANKRGSSSADWAKAYQAIKHNRTKNLSKGNLKFLIRAAAALFLLNLYYKNDVFGLSTNNNDNFSDSYSELFKVTSHNYLGEGSLSAQDKLKEYEESVFLIKWTDEYKNKHTEWKNEHSRNLHELIFSHPKVKQYINDNFFENGNLKREEYSKFMFNREYFNCFDMKNEYGQMIEHANNLAKRKLNFDWSTPAVFEAVINKHQKIYSFEN